MSFHKPLITRNGTEFSAETRNTSIAGGFYIEGEKGNVHLTRSSLVSPKGEALFTVDCYDHALANVVINVESREKPRFIAFCKDCGRYDRESDVYKAGTFNGADGETVRLHYCNERLSRPRLCGDGVTRVCLVESNFYYWITTNHGRKEVRRDVISKSSAYGREWKNQLVCWFDHTNKAKPTVARKRAADGSTAENKARPSGLGYGKLSANVQNAFYEVRTHEADD